MKIAMHNRVEHENEKRDWKRVEQKLYIFLNPMWNSKTIDQKKAVKQTLVTYKRALVLLYTFFNSIYTTCSTSNIIASVQDNMILTRIKLRLKTRKVSRFSTKLTVPLTSDINWYKNQKIFNLTIEIGSDIMKLKQKWYTSNLLTYLHELQTNSSWWQSPQKLLHMIFFLFIAPLSIKRFWRKLQWHSSYP